MRENKYAQSKERIDSLIEAITADLREVTPQMNELREIHTRTSARRQELEHSAHVMSSLQSRVASLSTDFRSVLETRTKVRACFQP
jgi:prefoldin subunit 5